MKVQDVMVKSARFCCPDTNLATVAKIFWEQGCGALPVVENGRAIGMVTDRDVSIALGTRNIKAGDTSLALRDEPRPIIWRFPKQVSVRDHGLCNDLLVYRADREEDCLTNPSVSASLPVHQPGLVQKQRGYRKTDRDCNHG
jgi:CBS domain-containing protein